MEKSEVAILVAGIDARYPNWKPTDIDAVIEAWYADLKDYPLETISEAFVIYRRNNSTGFAPSIDQLLELTHKVSDLSRMTPAEAWSLVDKAIRRSSVHAQEEFDKLPPLVRRAVGSPAQLFDWSQTNLEMIETSIARQFKTTYETLDNRERETERLPEVTQNRLKAIQTETVAMLPYWENPTPVVQAPPSDSLTTFDASDFTKRLRMQLLGGNNQC